MILYLIATLSKELTLKSIVEEVEKHYLQKALEITDIKARAAKLLGLDNHQTLNNKLKKYNLN